MRARTLLPIILCICILVVDCKEYNSAVISHDTNIYSVGGLVIPSEIQINKMLPLEPQKIDERSFICKDIPFDRHVDTSIKYPDFLYIGVAKGGSTSLSQYLRKKYTQKYKQKITFFI